MAEEPSLFLDANILFSAAYREGGASAAIFTLAQDGRCRLFASQYAVMEAEKNLQEKRPESLPRFRKLIKGVALVPEAGRGKQREAAAVGLDPGDVPILAAAAGKTDFLVTGDRRHFGKWMGRKVLGTAVISLADAVTMLLAQ